jgi:hypothetical protein
MMALIFIFSNTDIPCSSIEIIFEGTRSIVLGQQNARFSLRAKVLVRSGFEGQILYLIIFFRNSYLLLTLDFYQSEWVKTP